ncbi:BatD family protein [Marinobacter sp.]|uniref:BatD family protein n=1 Tax=Marinobacter sp. TaxID=50741 RepID=UPI003A9534F8
MVKRLIKAAVCLFLLTAIWLPVQAQELTVEPDRTQLYEGEVLTLTVKGSMEIDINLGNLFDFDMSNLPKPDIEKVQPDFEILAQNQQYSIQTINNQMVGEITWTYQLAPTTTGELTIPALTFNGAVSRPVTVEVVDGTPPDQADTGRDSFIELSADKAEVYVQEQLILTVRLFFRGNLIRGELSEPTHPNVVIEPLGRQQEFSRYRDGVRYRVVERRYALFPQSPGNFKLAPIRFEGQARDAQGTLKFLRDSEELFEIPVKSVPSQFTGKTWLPASSVNLTESGLPPTLEVDTGENLTRKIRLTASGLPSETLPPLPDAVPLGLRSYPEQPERTTETTPDGLTSSLSQSVALVPVESGQMTLPAIRIHWWDTQADRERVAVLPEKTLTVTAPTPGTGAVPPENTTTTGGKPPEISTGPSSPDLPAPGRTMPWKWLSLALAALWIGTLLVWWLSRRNSAKRPVTNENRKDRVVFERLIKAARDGAASTPELLVEWANLHAPGHGFHSSADVASHFQSEALTAEIRKLQARLFSPGQGTGDWDGRPLAKALQQIREATAKPETRTDLPPLYPKGLA